MWTLAALIAAGLIGWRFGLAGIVAAVTVVWVAGLAWLGFSRAQGGADDFVVMAWWTVLGAAVLLALGYAALIRLLHRNARRGAAAAAVAAPVPAPAPVPVDTLVTDPAGPLSDAELDRYARHIVLRELGGPGQRRLRAARVLVVGAGGLGAPALMYLAAAGVGRITVADDDTVSLSNLQRQVLFGIADLGRPKVAAAADALARLNPHVTVTPLERRITAGDAALIRQHDLVLDGSDSFASRSAVNAACVAAGVPLLAGAIAQWEGQLTLYDPARGGPCLACLFPDAPAPGLAPSCAEAGVVGALPGVIGSMMALETVKLLGGVVRSGVVGSGAGAGLRGQMVLFDGLWGETRRVSVSPRPGCAVCGAAGDVVVTKS